MAALVIDSETSRIRAALVNSGSYTLVQADAKLLSTQLNLISDADSSHTIAGQAALLTAVVTGTRCFGRVIVECPDNVPYRLSMPIPVQTLADAVSHFGAIRSQRIGGGRSVHFGAAPNEIKEESPWSIRAFWHGWTAGVLPAHDTRDLGPSGCALAGVAAGALAVAEAFSAEQDNPSAGLRAQTVSLWSLQDGLSERDLGPVEFSAPTSLWMIGLGNLGQANLWSLSTLRYAESPNRNLYLQDMQEFGPENWGTSVLVERGRYGVLKTKVAEDWAVGCGFKVHRVDRRLDQYQRLFDDEPSLALVGLDRIRLRRLVDGVGFRYVFDSGLGATAAAYRTFRLNTFDSQFTASKHFEKLQDADDRDLASNLQLPEYQNLLGSDKLDRCGVIQLAGIPVAIPFVSAVIGAITVAQLIRLASGQPTCRTLAGTIGDLRSLRHQLGDAPRRIDIPTAAAHFQH